MSQYTKFNIFPKLGQSDQSLNGGLKFVFQGRECYLVSEGDLEDLELMCGVNSKKTIPNYQPLYLYVLNSDEELFLEFELIEKISDILSLATGCHLALFSPVLTEYDYIPGWAKGDFKKDDKQFDGLKYNYSDKFFIKNDFLVDLIDKIFKSQFKERIIGAAHLNRLSKYKFSTHLTEALTDNVSALEALYMQYDGKRSNNLDYGLIDKKIVEKNQDKALKYFIDKYYPFKLESEKCAIKNILDNVEPYDKRSKYLHNGLMILPPRAVGQWLRTEKGAFEFDDYNTFQKIIFYAILNFIKMT